MSADSESQLSTREAITQAVDILTARHQVSEATAYEMLVEGSADSSEKVRQLASHIVDAGAGLHPRAVPGRPDVGNADVEVSLGGHWYPAELLEWQPESEGWMARVQVRLTGDRACEAVVADDLVRTWRLGR